MEVEEGGLLGTLWMGEEGVEWKCEEEDPHHGKGVLGVLGERKTNQANMTQSHMTTD